MKNRYKDEGTKEGKRKLEERGNKERDEGRMQLVETGRRERMKNEVKTWMKKGD